MFGAWLASIRQLGRAVREKVQNWIRARTKPATTSQGLETARDLLRSKTELVAENARKVELFMHGQNQAAARR